MGARSPLPRFSPFGGAFCVGTLKTPLVSQVMFALTMIPVRTPYPPYIGNYTSAIPHFLYSNRHCKSNILRIL